MVVDQVVGSVDLAYFHARMLQQMRALNPKANMDALLSQELTNGFQSAYYPPTSAQLGVYVGGDNTRKIMYIDGVNNTLHATQLIAGYQFHAGVGLINNLNLWIDANKNYYLGLMSAGHMSATEYFDFVGHSAGGAVATGLHWELQRLGDVRKRKVITFGAPRCGVSTVRDALSRSAIARWMTPGDPIPLVPPRLQDAPQLAAIIPVLTFLSWSRFTHTQGGIQVDASGNTFATDLPTESSVDTAASLADWFTSEENDPANQHVMPRYVANLQAAVARFVTPRQKVREVAPAEQPADDKKKDVNRQRDRIVTALSNSQRTQNAQIVNQPIIVLFQPIRQGRVWAVGFGEKIVCQGVREDTCRHLCRAGNDFLRSLPKQALVDPIALAAQFESFLAFATAPESEWVPKLQTNLDLS